MTLTEAQEIVRFADGRQAWWLREYGLTDIREALRVIRQRKSATREDQAVVTAVEYKLSRGL